MTDGPIIDVTKVSDKGQVVIPKEVRDRLRLSPGTKLIVVATDDAVVLQRIDAVAGKMKMRDVMDIVRTFLRDSGSAKVSPEPPARIFELQKIEEGRPRPEILYSLVITAIVQNGASQTQTIDVIAQQRILSLSPRPESAGLH